MPLTTFSFDACSTAALGIRFQVGGGLGVGDDVASLWVVWVLGDGDGVGIETWVWLSGDVSKLWLFWVLKDGDGDGFEVWVG